MFESIYFDDLFQNCTQPVSYTHLDVYKRQVHDVHDVHDVSEYQ